MASFQAKIGLKKMRNGSFRFVPTRRVIKNSKTNAKKFKKLKYTIMP